MPENGTVFTRTDANGKTLQRIAYTPADEVKLRFDGWAQMKNQPTDDGQDDQDQANAEPAEPPSDPVADYLMRQNAAREAEDTDGQDDAAGEPEQDAVPAGEEPAAEPTAEPAAEPAQKPRQRRAPTTDPAPSNGAAPQPE